MIDFQKQIQQLPSLLKAAEMRHQVLSQNLANANTPGYHRLDVNFEEQLAQVMAGEKSADSLEPQIVEDNSGSMRADGNNVDVDKEVGQLGKNAMLYQMYTELLNSQFRSMQQAMEVP
ncbi:MAG: flagellar basal body rod protein FlgB [Fuerstiella sp.]